MQILNSLAHARHSPLRVALAVAWLLVLTHFASPPAAHALTCTWVKTTGAWNVASNWSCASVPGPLDVAVINTNTSDVTLDAPRTVPGLNFSRGTLRNNYKLSITSSISWTGGTLSGTG